MAKQRTIEGILPPYLMLELIRRNPTELWHSKNIGLTQQLFVRGLPGNTMLPRANGSARVNVYDAKGTTRLPGTKFRFEPDPKGGDKTLDEIFDFSVAVRKFHKDVLGINSMDNLGMDYISTGHYGVSYNNAYNNGRQMVFGDGDQKIFKTFVIICIVAHEFSHQITRKYSNLTYYGQPGALNEHLADVDGVVARQYVLGISAADDTWLVGPGIFMPGINGVALRSMIAPGTGYDDPRLGKDPQPGHMNRYVETSSDNGGVHINSGIPNKAYALFSKAAGGNAWETTYPIWWEVRKAITSECDFQTFANKTVEVCKTLRPNLVGKLVQAWADVGIAAK